MLKGIPPKAKAVCVTAAVLLVLLAGHLFRTGDSRDLGWRFKGTAPPSWKGDGDGDGYGYQSAGFQNPYAESSSMRGLEPESVAAEPSETAASPEPVAEDEELPCQNLPGAEDVVVVMRTGATEIQDKLPVHLRTTFKCYSDLIIFSDYEETFEGHEVHDVLRPVSTRVKETVEDFEIYLRLQTHGRSALHSDELSGKASFEGSKSGKNDNKGWRLDKWKFLPMMVETHRLRPDKKFYVFVESDSYVVWSNLLRWLQRVDASKPFYAGSEVQIGPDVFAHGGSVFVMTAPAVRIGAELYNDDPEKWDTWTAGHWAGDCVLGKALHDHGVDLTWSWPMFQGGQPEKMDYTETKGEKKRLWCAPALSYHHFAPAEMKRMWDFEQSWIKAHAGADKTAWFREKKTHYENVLHHRDVFKSYIWPNLTQGETAEWNNLSPDRIPGSEGKTFEECRALCDANAECVQFNVAADGCWISTKDVMLGQPWGEVKSGWMVERVEAWMAGLDSSCGGLGGWTVT